MTDRKLEHCKITRYYPQTVSEMQPKPILFLYRTRLAVCNVGTDAPGAASQAFVYGTTFLLSQNWMTSEPTSDYVLRSAGLLPPTEVGMRLSKRQVCRTRNCYQVSDQPQPSKPTHLLYYSKSGRLLIQTVIIFFTQVTPLPPTECNSLSASVGHGMVYEGP
jgi:hypothetical protein